MKKINPPIVDDIMELKSLAKNKRLSSYPNLLNQCSQFCSKYEEYIKNAGNPWGIDPLPINKQFKKELHLHYNSPPTGRLNFIDDFRRNLSPTLCPMCGGFGNGTLDHYLPKDSYPEYSFFSKNLVPACSCNSLRGTTVKGVASPSRAIHPYFDDFLSDRLYQAVFKGQFDASMISIEIIDAAHPQKDILKFHLDEVISNEGTQGWFEKYWSDLSLRPHDILNLVLPEGQQNLTGATLKTAVERYRNSKDKEYNTPNNWYSIFYTGLMTDNERLDQLAKVINLSR